jgi:dihydrolipoamide dehydrogenase
VPHIFALGDITGQPILAHKAVHESLTKVLFDEASERVIGCGIARPNVGDLVAGAALAIGLAIRQHPKLSETIGMAAEMFEGSITDPVPPKRRH